MSEKDKICAEIQEIMADYREQESAGGVDTPGGLEHMGDVWRLFRKWDFSLGNMQNACLQNDHIAWLRYKNHVNGSTTVHLCNSGDEGAFRVYKR